VKVSVIIPAHNEEKLIEKTIKRIYDIMTKSGYNYEILVIDDNSNDKTGLIIERLSKINKKIIPIHKKTRTKGSSGLGSALRFGFKYCSGDIIIPFMGDLSDNPKDVPKLVNKILDGYDVVCGSRFIEGSTIAGYPNLKLLCNRIYNRLFAFLFHMKIKDISNAFKAYRKNVLKIAKPKSRGFEITSEIVLKSHIYGFKITEVPVGWRKREKEGGESKFGSFHSPRFIIFKLVRIGFSYVKLTLSLWFKFLSSKIIE